MNKKKKVTVLIADDQTLFREGIKDVLSNEKWIEVVGEAADGLEAVFLLLGSDSAGIDGVHQDVLNHGKFCDNLKYHSHCHPEETPA